MIPGGNGGGAGYDRVDYGIQGRVPLSPIVAKASLFGESIVVFLPLLRGKGLDVMYIPYMVPMGLVFFVDEDVIAPASELSAVPIRGGG